MTSQITSLVSTRPSGWPASAASAGRGAWPRMRAAPGDPGVVVEGKLARVAGMTLEAIGCEAALGARCLIEGTGGSSVEAEVVGFSGDRLFLMPTQHAGRRHAERPRHPHARRSPAWPSAIGLLGRVIDGAGNPLDGRGPLNCEARIRLEGRADQSPRPPADPRSRWTSACARINALFTAGRGQRLGLFAGSGVGKSTLLGMMTRYTRADVIVVGLIGERGREVKEFVEDNLGAGRSGALGRGRDAGRLLAAAAHPRRLAGHRDCRVFPRPGLPGPAADGLADPLRPGPARDRPRHRRAAGHQGLPALGLRPAAATGRARRHRATWAAARSRRSTRCSPKATTRTIPIVDAARADPRRPHHAVAGDGRERHLSADQRGVLDQPVHEPDRVAPAPDAPPRSSARSSPATCATAI